jgi:hypothetical protein
MYAERVYPPVNNPMSESRERLYLKLPGLKAQTWVPGNELDFGRPDRCLSLGLIYNLKSPFSNHT